MRFVRLIGLMIFVFAFGPVGQAWAQTLPTSVVDAQLPVIEALIKRTDGLAARIDANKADDVKLVEIRNELEAIGRDLLASAVAFRPKLAEINGRLTQLGPAPAQGEVPEAEAVATERAGLLKQKAEINAVLGKAEDASQRVSQLGETIADLRRVLFANQLSKRYDITFALGAEAIEAFKSETAELVKVISSWLRFVARFKIQSVLLAAFFALCAAAVLVIGGRRVFGPVFQASSMVKEPSYLSRLTVAFGSTLLPSAALAVFLFSVWFFFDYFNVLRGDIGAMMITLFNVIATFYFVQRLASAALSPKLPAWRLLPVENGAAQVLYWLVSATALVTGLDFLFNRINQVLASPLSLTVGKSLVATVIVGVLVLLIGRIKPLRGADGALKPWPRPLRYGLFGLGGVTILASLLGYIGFARFLSAQIVITAAILATMYIGFLTASAISEEGAFAKTRLGHQADRLFSLGETGLDQLALAAGIAINLFVVLAGLPLILLQWGFQWGDIRAFALKLATGVQIGSVTISLIGIITGILVFTAGFFLTRWFQRWLDGSVMSRGRVDPGVRNSIRTAVGYAGVALAGIIGISAAGIDLSSLALVAGALSLGIGFGLQNIVSNFVSGLILLAERPFKVGDWIIAGAVSGTVKRISVRATEIETFQRQTIILPNSDLINQAVGNWTHRNKLGRVDLPVSVAYGSDVEQVQRILLDIARAEPMILKNPEPVIAFMGFGASSLDFELRVFLSDILNMMLVQNNVRFAILAAFRANHIDIPFPQREIVVKRAPDIEILDELAGEPPTARPGRRRKKGLAPDS